MSQQENILSERLNKENENAPDFPKNPNPQKESALSMGPMDSNKMVDALNSSELIVDDQKPTSPSSYQLILGWLLCNFLMDVWGKFIMEHCSITPFEIIYARGVISVILSMIYLKVNDIYLFSVETDKSAIVLGGALCGFIGVSGFYVSLYLLNITSAFALDFMALMFMVFVDYVWFKVGIKFYQMVGILAAIIGTLFIIRPGYLFDESAEPIHRRLFSSGVVAGLVGALFTGFYCGILRRTYVKVNLLVSLTFNQFAMALFSPCMVLVHFEIRGKPTTYTMTSLLSLLCIGCLGWATQWFLANILKEEKIVSRVYPYKYSLVILGVLLDLSVFSAGLAFSSFLGVLLIGVHFAAAIYYLWFATK